MPAIRFLPDRPVDEAVEGLRSLAQGGLPLRAQRRIFEHNEAAEPIFTSTLSVAEGVVAGRHRESRPSATSWDPPCTTWDSRAIRTTAAASLRH